MVHGRCYVFGDGVRAVTHVFGDGVGVVDAVDPLAHEHGLLLVLQRLLVVAHDVVEPRQHPQTLRYLCNHNMEMGASGGVPYSMCCSIV